MAESERALADALEYDRIELSPGDQIHRRIEAIGRKPGAGVEAKLLSRSHAGSLAQARAGGPPP